jgi:hypothetical protein
MEPLVSLDGPGLNWGPETGAVTAEYAIAILAATGFAGLLLAILQSDTVRGWLSGIVQKALGA